MKVKIKIMFECIEANDFTTEAMFLSSYPWDKYVLVQDDALYRVLKKFFKKNDVIIRGFDGRRKGREAIIKILKNYSEKARFIGIINTEYNCIINDLSENNLNNLLTTDYYDLNTQIFYSKALEKYIEMSMEEPEKIEINSIREKCINIAGYFRNLLGGILKCLDDKTFFEQLLERPEFNIENHLDKEILSMEISEIQSKLLENINMAINNCEDIDSNRIKEVENIFGEIINNESQMFLIKKLAKGKDLLKIFAKMMLLRMDNLENPSLSEESIAFYNSLRMFRDLIKGLENTLKGYYGIKQFIKSNLCINLYKSFKAFLDKGLIREIKNLLKKEKLIGFISHSSRDFNYFEIDKVARMLEDYPEIDTIFYFEDRSGKDFVEDMNDNIKKSDFILLFCTPNAFESSKVNDEWHAAYASDKTIFPIFVDEKHIPIILSSKLGVRFKKGDTESFIKAVYNKIKKETFFHTI
ncbi:MAG: toll/interleukin-1 receptor domain-containing protein [Promethearchaeota archaeon]|nr:MAG: toll/interleukin-1 receptor domain-containing protein [Candidatus Lokiarchaeota archaeon]